MFIIIIILAKIYNLIMIHVMRIFGVLLGQVFGNMNYFTGLGIFVDTYPNDDKQHDVCFIATHVMSTITILQSISVPYEGKNH